MATTTTTDLPHETLAAIAEHGNVSGVTGATELTINWKTAYLRLWRTIQLGKLRDQQATEQ